MKKVYMMVYDMGGAHRSTANSLKEVIEKRKLPWEIHIVEFFKEIVGTSTPQNIFNNYLLQKSWLRRITGPVLVPLFKLQVRLSSSAWLKRLQSYWHQHQPDMVISLMPYVNRELCQSLNTALPGVPFITIPTDFFDYPPHFWYEQQEQFVVCPSEKAVEQARALGHLEERIFQTSGVVINPRFYEPVNVDRRIERQRLGLDPDLPTGLVMFGGQGSKVMINIAEYLERSPLNLQLIFICGRNEELASILRRSQGRLPKFVETFTKEIPYYMHISDFFIGKPGLGSMYEALLMKRPVITESNASTLFLERYNAEWIVNNQVGIVVNDFRNIAEAVAEIIKPENLVRYQANTTALNNQAVFEVVDFLEKTISSSALGKTPEREPIYQ